MDFADTDEPEDTTILTHGLVNITATLLFAGSFLLRRRAGWQTQPSHVALAALGYAAVVFGGFLGGSLIFRHGVMVNRNAYRASPKKFTDAIALKELAEDKLTRVEVEGEPILLVRRGKEIYAVGAVCSHYGAPMEKGKLEGDTVECPWHYSVYSICDGAFLRGPTTAPLPAYETRVREGQVQVRLQQSAQ
jgi:nitrite reductase/ring-hydroxylating ferredoxin subunit